MVGVQKFLVVHRWQTVAVRSTKDRCHNVPYVRLHPLKSLEEWPPYLGLLRCPQNPGHQDPQLQTPFGRQTRAV